MNKYEQWLVTQPREEETEPRRRIPSPEHRGLTAQDIQVMYNRLVREGEPTPDTPGVWIVDPTAGLTYISPNPPVTVIEVPEAPLGMGARISRMARRLIGGEDNE